MPLPYNAPCAPGERTVLFLFSACPAAPAGSSVTGSKNPQRLAAGFGLGLTDEFLAAFRAADAQLAAVLRDPDGLPARRAAIIAVVAVAQPHPQLQESAVLPLAAAEIPRKHADHGEDQQTVHQQ